MLALQVFDDCRVALLGGFHPRCPVKKRILAFSCFFLTCLAPSSVSARQQSQEHQRNYNNCLHGYAGCDSSQLTDIELTQVQQAARQRNYNSCLRGYVGCNPSQLTEAERPAVQEAAHQRNYNNCLHGYVGCDTSQLTDSERVTIGSQSTSTTGQNPPPRYYINKDGQRVQSPTYYDKAPAGATAQCRDGTYSFSQHHQGTCSHHGGVAKWLD